MKNSFMIVITVTELSAITKKLVTYDKANLVVPSLDPHTLTCKPTSLNKIKTITRSMLDAFHYAIIGQYLEESDDGEEVIQYLPHGYFPDNEKINELIEECCQNVLNATNIDNIQKLLTKLTDDCEKHAPKCNISIVMAFESANILD